MDARPERRGLVEREARREERGLEQQEHEVTDRLVALVGVSALAQLLHDHVVRVDLQRLLARHVGRHRVVAQGLRLHDALHVGRPAVLARHEHARGVDDAVRDDDLLDAVAEDVLDQRAEGLQRRALLLLLGLLLLGVDVAEVEALCFVSFPGVGEGKGIRGRREFEVMVKTNGGEKKEEKRRGEKKEEKRRGEKEEKPKKRTLGARDQLLAVVLLELLDAVLVDGVDLLQ